MELFEADLHVVEDDLGGGDLGRAVRRCAAAGDLRAAGVLRPIGDLRPAGDLYPPGGERRDTGDRRLGGDAGERRRGAGERGDLPRATGDLGDLREAGDLLPIVERTIGEREDLRAPAAVGDGDLL